MIDMSKFIQGGGGGSQAPVANTQPVGGMTSMLAAPGQPTLPSGSLPGASGGYMPQDPYQDYQMQAPQQFPYPGQWEAASNIYGNIGQGAPFSTNQWGIGGNQLAQMAQGGQPVDVSGLEATYGPMMQRLMKEMTQQGAEEAGMSGTRYSSPFARSITEMGSKIGENFANTMAMQNIQAQEAARGRQMGAFGELGQRGGMDLQAQQANRGLQLGAAGGLQGLGSDYLYAPMNVGQGMMGMGGAMQGQQQGMADAMSKDPYAAWAASMAGSMGNQYVPESYQPGWASMLMDAGGAFAPWMSNFMKNGGLSEGDAQKVASLAGGF